MPVRKPAAGNPPPVNYRGGVLYTSFASRQFRALKVKGDKWTEKSSAWGGAKPSMDAWKKCVTAIDDHYDKQK